MLTLTRWADAQQHADKVSRDGAAFFNDWRVPALRELATITDRGCNNPRTNLVGLSRHACGAVLVVHRRVLARAAANVSWR